MLNKITIGKINKEIATDYNGVVQPGSGLNYNDENQLIRAISIAKFAKKDYKEASNEEFSECLKYLLIALSSLNENSKKTFSEFAKYLCIASLSGKDALKDHVKMAKYSLDIIALKNQIKEMNLMENLDEIKDNDIVSLIDTLIEVLKMEMSAAKHAMDNNIKYSDIKSVDMDSIYLNGTDGEISMAKMPYLSAKVKNDVKYGLSLLGLKALNGTSKVLKRINK